MASPWVPAPVPGGVAVITLVPVTLERDGVRLEPLTEAHCQGLMDAAADGLARDTMM